MLICTKVVIIDYLMFHIFKWQLKLVLKFLDLLIYQHSCDDLNKFEINVMNKNCPKAL